MNRTQVDHNAVKFGQVTIVAVVLLALALARPGLIWVLAALLLVNVAWPARGPLRLLYRYVVLPLRVVRPNPVVDELAPHRFAQGVGGTLLVAAGAAFPAGAPVVGWALAGLVAALAAVNIFWNFCAGCFVYYQLRRMGLLRRPVAS